MLLIYNQLELTLQELTSKFHMHSPTEALDPAKPMFVFADAEHRVGTVNSN